MEYWSDSPDKYWNLQNPSKDDIEESLKKYFNSNKKVNYNINGITRINSKQLQVKLEVAFDSNNIVDKEFNVIIVFDDENKITSEYQIDR